MRGNCLLPKCRFPHPPFKIPEGLPKPADPIANPPAAAAKQKAAAQAAAAAAAAEGSGTKELAIVTWLGHWHCSCGRVHKLWDSCRCGQAPPCREWVRGQCEFGEKCRFPHPPFAIPASLPKPDDPIANPTPEQLAFKPAPGAARGGGSRGEGPRNGVAAGAANGRGRGASAAPKAAPGETPKAALGEAPSGGPVPAAKRTASVSYASLLRPEAADPEPAALLPLPDAAPAATLPGNGAAGAAGRQASSGGAGAAAVSSGAGPAAVLRPEAVAAALSAAAAAAASLAAAASSGAASSGGDPSAAPSGQGPPPPSTLAAAQAALASPRWAPGSLAMPDLGPLLGPLPARAGRGADPGASPFGSRALTAAPGWNPLSYGGGGGAAALATSLPPAGLPDLRLSGAEAGALRGSSSSNGGLGINGVPASPAAADLRGAGGSPGAAVRGGQAAPVPALANGGGAHASPAAATAGGPGSSQLSLHAALQQMALQQAAAAAQAAAAQRPLRALAATLAEVGLLDPAFLHALGHADFLPDGHYQADTLTLEESQRRADLFNAAVDHYIQSGWQCGGLCRVWGECGREHVGLLWRREEVETGRSEGGNRTVWCPERQAGASHPALPLMDFTGVWPHHRRPPNSPLAQRAWTGGRSWRLRPPPRSGWTAGRCTTAVPRAPPPSPRRGGRSSGAPAARWGGGGVGGVRHGVGLGGGIEMRSAGRP